MFFEKWRMRRMMNIFRPSLGRDALSPAHKRRGEVELICVVTRVQNFESIAARLSLRDLGDQMNKFYGAVADAILGVEGDINRFCGAAVVGHFNVLYRVEEARIIEGAMNVFRNARAAFDAVLDARIGVGICRGVAIAGSFGSVSRLTFTAFGPSEICAHHLAEQSDALNLCEEFATHFSRPVIPSQAWISVQPHWKIDSVVPES
jgi:class 3 adenylate cyclase